jgi:hypothetical protein
MGLTIHYSLKSRLDANVKQTVEKMRQMTLDLPFDRVGEIVDLKGNACDFEKQREDLQSDDQLRWMLVQAAQTVACPWNKRLSRRINPRRVVAFNTWPGRGCEAANFGLCLYPTEIEWKYSPEDDERFEEAIESGCWTKSQLSWDKWDRHCKKNRLHTRSPAAFTELRRTPTMLSGWRWGSFCKTQYASDPRCGGLPNFLRCHICVITALERMGKLPGLRVKISDEGKYGPSTYSDDWQEARDAGRKPTYRRHKGQYNPEALANEVGDWNTMVAGVAGAMSDALGGGMKLISPIKEFPDFERLEFRGRNAKYLTPFLTAMKRLADETQAPDEES